MESKAVLRVGDSLGYRLMIVLEPVAFLTMMAWSGCLYHAVARGTIQTIGDACLYLVPIMVAGFSGCHSRLLRIHTAVIYLASQSPPE